jgi:hypothetical protein
MPKIIEVELVQRTQELYDAVGPGNQARWKMYVADDAMFFDEKGRAMDKPAQLGKPYQLMPESTDLFFRVGVEGRRLFHRDASGHVDMMKRRSALEEDSIAL